MDHDQNFKNLILDYPRQALEFFATREARELDDQARILPIREEQLKDRLGDRFRRLDVPLLIEWPDGHKAALLFAIEEETDPKRFSIHRLAHYCLDLAEMFALNQIIPVVIFLKPGSAQSALHLGSDRHTYLQFHYLSCRLSSLPYEHYRDSDNIVARLNLPNMQYPEEAQHMSTFSEQFRQESIQQGMQRGMQEESAAMLLNLIEQKFGNPAKAYREKIQRADVDTLNKWSSRLLKAKTLDEVLH